MEKADGSIIIDTSVDLTGIKKFTVAVTAVTTALAAAGGYAIKVGSDFEAGMSKVQAISGATGDDLDALTQKAKDMGASTKFSATEAASAFEYMAMAGWKTEDMLGGIKGIMDLAAASGESLALTSDIVTDALTAFGMSAQESGRFADVLAAASSNANTNVAMMGATFKYAAPVAGALGYSIEDTALAIGLMANAGVKAETAGTALRGMLTNLAKPSNEVASYMKELGVSLTDSAGKVKPLNQLILELRDSFDGLTEAQKAEYAAGIAGKEAMSGLLAIVNASDADFNKLSKAIENSNGAAAKMAEVMQGNLRGAITILGSTVEGLGNDFYDNVKVVATESVKELTKTLSSTKTKQAVMAFGEGFSETTAQIAGFAEDAIPAAINAAAVFASHVREIAAATAAAYVAFKSFSIIKTVTSTWVDATKALAAFETGTKAATLATAIKTGELKLSGLAVGVLTGKITLATAAQSAWNVVAGANPYGIAIAAIAALTLGFAAYYAMAVDSTDATKKFVEETDELEKSSKELRNSLEESAKQRKKAAEDLEAEAGGASILSKSLYELARKTDKTADEKQRMLVLVDQLNEQIPDLNLAYDSENDMLNKQEGELKKVIAANLEMQKVKAAQGDMAKISSEIYQVEKRRAEISAQLSEIEKRRGDIEHELAGESNALTGAYTYRNTALMKSTENTRDLSNAQAKLQTEDKELAVVQAQLNEEYSSAGNYIAQASKSAEQATENIKKLKEAGLDAGTLLKGSAEELAEAFQLTEKQIKSLQDHLNDYHQTATNIFSSIKQDSALSMQEMINNLQANQKAMDEWSTNIALAAARGVDEGLLQQLIDAGPESAAHVANIVNASDAEIQKLNEVFRNGTRLAVEASNIEIAILKNDMPAIVASTVESAASAMRAGAILIGNATATVREAARQELEPLKDEFESIGLSAVQSLAAGIYNGASAAADAIDSVLSTVVFAGRKKAEVNSPSKLVARELGAPMAEGLSFGMEKALPMASRQMQFNVSDMVSRMRAAVDAEVASSSSILTSSSNHVTNNSRSNTTTLNVTVHANGGAAAQLDARAIAREIGRETQAEMRSRGIVIT